MSSQRTDRTTVAAWASWDWGSAAFNAVMVTFIYSVYLTESVGADIGGSIPASSWYGWAMAAAGIIIAVVAPVQGRRADAKGRRRWSMAMWTLVVVALMASLFFIENEPAWFWPGIVIMAIGAVAFEFAEVSYFARSPPRTTSAASPGSAGRRGISAAFSCS